MTPPSFFLVAILVVCATCALADQASGQQTDGPVTTSPTDFIIVQFCYGLNGCGSTEHCIMYYVFDSKCFSDPNGNQWTFSCVNAEAFTLTPHTGTTCTGASTNSPLYLPCNWCWQYSINLCNASSAMTLICTTPACDQQCNYSAADPFFTFGQCIPHSNSASASVGFPVNDTYIAAMFYPNSTGACNSVVGTSHFRPKHCTKYASAGVSIAFYCGWDDPSMDMATRDLSKRQEGGVLELPADLLPVIQEAFHRGDRI